MNSSLKYSIQLLNSHEQLTEAFQLRHRTYKKSYPNAIKDLQNEFETDLYDQRSIHLGLFVENKNEKTMVGYSRLIIPPFFENKFSNLYFKNHSLYFLQEKNNISIKKMALMNFLSCAESLDSLNRYCDTLENKNEVYCETSRFIIAEQHRSLSLSAFFVSGMVAICNSMNISFCFFHCDPHHIAFYKKFGINIFPGLDSFDTYCYGKRIVIIGAVMEAMRLFKSSIVLFTNQFSAENQITFKRAA